MEFRKLNLANNGAGNDLNKLLSFLNNLKIKIMTFTVLTHSELFTVRNIEGTNVVTCQTAEGAEIVAKDGKFKLSKGTVKVDYVLEQFAKLAAENAAVEGAENAAVEGAENAAVEAAELAAWKTANKEWKVAAKKFTDVIDSVKQTLAYATAKNRAVLITMVTEDLASAEKDYENFLSANPEPVKPFVATEAQLAELKAVTESGLTVEDYADAVAIVAMFTTFVKKQLGITATTGTGEVGQRAAKNVNANDVRSHYNNLRVEGYEHSKAMKETAAHFGLTGSIQGYIYGKIGAKDFIELEYCPKINDWAGAVWYGRDGKQRSGVASDYSYSHIEKHTAHGLCKDLASVAGLIELEKKHKGK